MTDLLDAPDADARERTKKAYEQAKRHKMIQQPGVAKAGLLMPGKCPYCRVAFTTAASLLVGSPLKCHHCGRTFLKRS